MIKYTLQFDEESDFMSALNGARYQAALWEMDQWLRTQIKYAGDDVPELRISTLEECRRKLHDFGVDINP